MLAINHKWTRNQLNQIVLPKIDCNILHLYQSVELASEVRVEKERKKRRKFNRGLRKILYLFILS